MSNQVPSYEQNLTPTDTAGGTMKRVVGLVLSGGLGTRLGSDSPKSLYPIQERPIIEHVLDPLIAAGIGRVVLIVAHKAQAVRDHFPEERRGNTIIDFTDQKEPKGVLPGVALALTEHAAQLSGSVVVCDGDTIIHGLDLKKAHSFHREHGADTTYVTTNVSPAETYLGPGIIGDIHTGQVERIDPSAVRGDIPGDIIFTGCMITNQHGIDTLSAHDERYTSWQDMVELLGDRGTVNQYYDPSLRFLNINSPAIAAEASAYLESMRT